MDSQEQRISIINRRISYLKEARRLVNQYLKENIDAQQVHGKAWERKAIAKNIEQLSNYAIEIKNSLTKKSLNEYAESRLFLLNAHRDKNSIPRLIYETVNTIKDGGYLFEITRYSINYSILHDLYWITDGYVEDHSAIAKGEKGPEFFESYCESTIEKLKKATLPYLKENESYKEASKILDDICILFPDQTFLSTNILLHSLIESMVRTLAKFVYFNQHPGISIVDAESYVSHKQSLESLIGGGDWKADIPIRFADAVIRHRYIQDKELQTANNLLKKQEEIIKEIFTGLEQQKIIIQDEGMTRKEKTKKIKEISNSSDILTKDIQDFNKLTVHVSLKVELQFLLRRYKENRNAVVHGNFKGFNKKWHCYLNLSTVYKIYEVIKIYDKLYPTSS